MKKSAITATLLIAAGRLFAAPAFDLPSQDLSSLRGSTPAVSPLSTPEPGQLPGEEALLPDQHMLLARMTVMSLKSAALALTGLEEMNSPHKAPREYTARVTALSEALIERLSLLEDGLHRRNGREAFLESVKMRKGAGELRETSALIAGSPNFTYWGGRDLEYAASELDGRMTSLRKSLPWLYSFVTPELKTEKLRGEWEAFTTERKEALARWEEQTLRGELSFKGLDRLLNSAATLREMWEIYQEAAMKRSGPCVSLEKVSEEKGLRGCFFKTLRNDTCVYRCVGGASYEQPMQRPSPWDDRPVVPCPQIVFPF
ncbi:MAG TPA: hypothetical protein PK523_04740 [Elusimicrobiales bacterium]|nr:hypothetical protein [Elusimicrobiales bacterium]